MSMLLPKHNDSFIVVEGFADWFNLTIPMYYCEFEQENYSDHLFVQMNIPFSDSLKNAVVKRRTEFLAGRYCAMHSMRVHGVHSNDIKIGKHRNPLWPAPLIGSISHCGSLAVAVTCNASSAYGVGVDIEAEVEARTMETLSQQVLCNEERTFIEEQSIVHGGSKRQNCLLFTLIFSVKESFFKAAYPLVEDYFDFDAISVIAISWNSRMLQFRVNKTLHQKIEKGMVVNGAFTILPDGKVATLVILNK